MNLTATKVWGDENNVFGLRPANIQLQLVTYTNPEGTTGRQVVPGTLVTVSATSPTPWAYTWENLPIRRNATGTSVAPIIPGSSDIIYYAVEEIPNPVNANYLAGIITYALDSTGSQGAVNSVGAVQRTINGSIQDDTGKTHRSTVTNNLDTVNIEVLKVWDDHHDLYGQRPTTLTFTLQRLVNGVWTDVEKPSGTVWREILPVDKTGYPGAAATQDLLTTPGGLPRFSGLPRLNTSVTPAVPWQYRVLETDAAGVTFTPTSGNPTSGIMGDTTYNHYTFTSSTANISGTSNFRTTVTNKINVTTITISGTKEWADHRNAHGTRPDNLELEVWYYSHVAPIGWTLLPEKDNDELNWEIKWDKTTNSDNWEFTIEGFGLARYVYVSGSAVQQQYAVREKVPSGYTCVQSVLESAPTQPGIAQPDNSTIGNPLRDANGNIKDAIFENERAGAVTQLQVNKIIENGPDYTEPNAPRFTFNVFFSANEMPGSNNNLGRLYNNHSYYVIDTATGDSIESIHPVTGAIVPAGDSIMIRNGNIIISAGQSFVLNDVPVGMYYRIDELNHPSYMLEPGNVMTGQVSTTPMPIVSHDVKNIPRPPSGGGDSGGRLPEISIINETPNEGLINGVPGGLTNAGGMVAVELPGTTRPDEWDSDLEVPSALAVLWRPNLERFWSFSDEITVSWTNFDDNIEHEVTIKNFLNPDGSFKSLSSSDISNPIFRQRFPNARLEMRNGVARLVLCADVDNMPRTVTVYVYFLPSIAVNNVTAGNRGGKVMVDCGVRGGNLNNNADGVPALGGVPYVGTTRVYGKPDPGYRVDWSYIVIRNLNDLGGVIGDPVFIKPNADGTFVAHLETIIAGKREIVEKTGRVYEGSIVVELDGLPVPLQIDLRFVPDGTRTGLPQTGVESVVAILIVGLVTSLVAGAAVVVVIRRMNAKERRETK